MIFSLLLKLNLSDVFFYDPDMSPSKTPKG